jgi:hypothetical protein
MDGVIIMTPSTKVGIAGIVLGLILLAILPWWAAVGIIIIAAAIPVGGYLALDKSQRRRLRAIRARQRLSGGRPPDPRLSLATRLIAKTAILSGRSRGQGSCGGFCHPEDPGWQAREVPSAGALVVGLRTPAMMWVIPTKDRR